MLWMKNTRCSAPDDLDVLLFVTEFHEKDLKYELDSNYVIGFYSSDGYKYKMDLPNGDRILIENDTIKVIAWALLKEPSKELNKWMKELSK